MGEKITVLGGGAMATACSILLADHAGQEVTLWMRNSAFAADVERHRENRRMLPGVPLPETIAVTSDARAALRDADCIVLSIPSKFLREALVALRDDFRDSQPIVSVVKGIEMETFQRPSEVICDVLGPRRIVALSGPSHAEEIARALPASVVAASSDIDLARHVQTLFATDRFRVYANDDLVGVELAGALKNVIAIAAGISDGLGYGDNAKSALMTRGLVEMTRFGRALGAQPLTFSGLAGMGDLITTCTSPFGRNRAVGKRLGAGESLDTILDSMSAVAEGVTTTRSVHEMARARGIDMPITGELYGVLFEGRSPVEATNRLMLRPPRDE